MNLRYGSLTLIMSLLLNGTAYAQKPKTMRIGEPSSVGVAAIGTVLVGFGGGIMLYQDECHQNCKSNVPYIIGGAVVVAAGVTLVYLGLRPKTVIIAPMITPNKAGLTGVVRW